MAELKIKADSGGGTVSFKGPATTTSNAAVQLTLPVDDGTSGQYLKTDGSGALSWATVAVGGATGTDYNDSVKVRLGTGNDLEIYHDGSNSHIKDSTDYLFLYGNNGLVLKTNAAGTAENAIRCINNGSVELYHDNTKQCETSADGLAFPSGKGINFSATSDGSTSPGELLSDYEQGSWDATCDNSVTLTHDELFYTKIGRLVHVCGYLTVNSDNSNSAFVINNLPFAANSGFGLSTPHMRLHNWNIDSDCKWVSGYTEANKIYFQQNRDDGNNPALAADSGAVMILNLSYYQN